MLLIAWEWIHSGPPALSTKNSAHHFSQPPKRKWFGILMDSTIFPCSRTMIPHGERRTLGIGHARRPHNGPFPTLFFPAWPLRKTIPSWPGTLRSCSLAHGKMFLLKRAGYGMTAFGLTTLRLRRTFIYGRVCRIGLIELFTDS